MLNFFGLEFFCLGDEYVLSFKSVKCTHLVTIWVQRKKSKLTALTLIKVQKNTNSQSHLGRCLANRIFFEVLKIQVWPDHVTRDELCKSVRFFTAHFYSTVGET